MRACKLLPLNWTKRVNVRAGMRACVHAVNIYESLKGTAGSTRSHAEQETQHAVSNAGQEPQQARFNAAPPLEAQTAMRDSKRNQNAAPKGYRNGSRPFLHIK